MTIGRRILTPPRSKATGRIQAIRVKLRSSRPCRPAATPRSCVALVTSRLATRCSSSSTCRKLLCVSRAVHDLREAARVETGTADERTVDIRLRHECGGVVRLHAAAVLNANFGSRRGIGDLAERL